MRASSFAVPLAFLLLVSTLARAADPPGRVGRLSYIDGTVSFHLADQGDWSPATLNYPVITGESFWTDENSRAEIQIGPAELRLDQTSQLDIASLDDRSIDVQLDQGVLNLDLEQMPPGEVSVITPRGRVVINEPGRYDIDAGQPSGDQPSDQIQVSVFAGSARFEGDRGALDIAPGQAALIGGEPMNVQLIAANRSDFDNWVQDREQREANAQRQRIAPAPIPAAVTGYQDLYQYGDWSSTPDYGEIWYPSDVPVGWAPYRYGHWAWVPPWGWTWIDDAPWGFAPFHYGRWIAIAGRWAWVPEDIPPQPVYAPALVTFIGGNGWGIDLVAGATLAAIGWVALAPHELYHPYYRTSETYSRSINGRYWNAAAFNRTNLTAASFRNRDAAIVVPATAFTHAAPVQRATVTVPPEQLSRARATQATITNLQPSPFARVGRPDPTAAAALVPQPNASGRVSQRLVRPTTPPALATQRPPTAPGPHRVAAPPGTKAPQRVQTPTAPNQPRERNVPNQPPVEATPRAPSAPNLAPHPTPPLRPQAAPGGAARPPQSRTEQPNAGAPRPTGPASVVPPRGTAPSAPTTARPAAPEQQQRPAVAPAPGPRRPAPQTPQAVAPQQQRPTAAPPQAAAPRPVAPQQQQRPAIAPSPIPQGAAPQTPQAVAPQQRPAAAPTPALQRAAPPQAAAPRPVAPQPQQRPIAPAPIPQGGAPQSPQAVAPQQQRPAAAPSPTPQRAAPRVAPRPAQPDNAAPTPPGQEKKEPPN